jgi:hypothetical protein
MGVPARTASVTVADQTFKVSQAAGPECTYTVSPNIQVFPAAGASSDFSVTAGAVCAWTAVSSAPWITINGAASGTGNGGVSFTVSPNAPVGPERAATITVGRSIFTVIQAAIYRPLAAAVKS